MNESYLGKGDQFLENNLTLIAHQFYANLTYSGYGRLNLRRVFDVLAGVTG